MKRGIALLIGCACLLTGCSALLDREYSTSEPHTSKFWESEQTGILRAENYQDIVNDLLLLIEQHTEQATLRLYQYEGEEPVADLMAQAAKEVQEETPMGAYAVEYITSSSQRKTDFYEIALQISYNRTADQLNALVTTTSTEALSGLLDAALDEGRQELAVRITSWTEESEGQIQSAVQSVRRMRGMNETPPWTIHCYPKTGPVRLIEFVWGDSEGISAESK